MEARNAISENAHAEHCENDHQDQVVVAQQKALEEFDARTRRLAADCMGYYKSDDWRRAEDHKEDCNGDNLS